MTTLPPRRKFPLSRGIGGSRRSFPTHRAWVRKHSCSIRGCKGVQIEFAHLRTAANAGMGLKPRDSYGISLCTAHHRIAHARGHATLAEATGMALDQLFAIAAEFARRTPDKALREIIRAAAADSSGAEESA